MEIYYLFNSGFLIEIGDDALIIDYYRGDLGKPWKAPLERQPSGYRDVYVFASHVHGDHYNRAIFNWLSERDDIKYILSDDIKPSVPAALIKKGGKHSIDFLADGGRLSIGRLDIRAYGSTDEGISFHIVAEDGTSIFHAGDLNYWHWRDESTEAEIAEAFTMFINELDKIKKGVEKIDYAFFPVDPRMGSDYYRGAAIFCETMKPARLIPMHSTAALDPPKDFFDAVAAYTKVIRVGAKSGKLNVY